MASDPEKIEQQRELYGEPVGDLVRRIMTGLDLTQSDAARMLGLSAAMLSQLMSGHRVKIGNPLVVSRLQSLLALVNEAPGLTQGEIDRELDEIRDSRATLTTGSRATVATEASYGTGPAAQVALVRSLLRAVASGRELDRAAAALDDVAPGVAEVIRLYGTGDPAEAERHLAGITHLLDDTGR